MRDRNLVLPAQNLEKKTIWAFPKRREDKKFQATRAHKKHLTENNLL